MNGTQNRLLASWIKTVCTLLLTASASIAAFAADTPGSLENVTLVTAEQAKKMMEAGVSLIDTRVANEYVYEHVKGAKNVPYKEKSAKSVAFDPKEDSFDLAKLPADKNTPFIFYCNAGECWKSYKASKVAVDAGHRKVNWMRGGIPEWKAKGYPVE